MSNQIPQQIEAQTDVGLRNFMLGTYRYMAMAMGVTAVVAFFLGQYLMANPNVLPVLYNPFVLLGFVIAIPFIFGGVGAKLHSMSKGGVLTFLFGFAAFMGIFMSVITLQFRVEVIAKIFFMTVALFGALSVFGHTTNKDLSGVARIAGATFLAYVAFMVLGAFFPSIAPSGTFEMLISAVALVAISILVAWKTQMLKQLYYGYAGNAGMVEKMAAYGAAMLLLSFINMFQLLLSLFGNE